MEAQSAKEHDDETTKKNVFARVSSQGGDSRFERGRNVSTCFEPVV